VREGHGCRFVVHDFQRQIIGIEAINKVIDAFSSSISMGDNYDLMSSFNEALRDKCGFPHLPYLGSKSQTPCIYYGYKFYRWKDFQD
jgi:hypothetical protein